MSKGSHRYDDLPCLFYALMCIFCRLTVFFGKAHPLCLATSQLNLYHTSSSRNSKCIVPFLYALQRKKPHTNHSPHASLAQYNALKEKGFYGNIMGTSAVFSIFCDSIRFSEENMSFTYYGRQRIERRTSVLMRELVTEGYLKRVPRTENNPHGLLIVNWRTILNKDLEQRTKSNY